MKQRLVGDKNVVLHVMCSNQLNTVLACVSHIAMAPCEQPWLACRRNRFGKPGDYNTGLAFQRRQFADQAQIVLPGVKDVLQAAAYSSSTQQQVLHNVSCKCFSHRLLS